MTTPAIETTALTRRFGDFTAVDNVNLRVDAGQFFGFLGPNGAGKSTTIKMLTGLLAPTSGSISILGRDLQANSAEIKQQIGVVPEGMAFFGRLTADEYLRFVGRMYGLDRSTTLSRTRDLLEFMQLAGEQKKLIADFSHGMQKKLALAAAVIHGPKVLFLDEPFEGVDAVAAGTLKAMLLRMIARGATIFLTSHVLEIVERLCTHIAIIHRGRLVAQGSLDELRAGTWRGGQAEIREGAAPPDEGEGSPDKRSLEQIFLEIVGTDREGDPAATASEQELSWLSSTSPESVPGSLPPIPVSAQLLAVAWLRWRIFVNGMFRRRPKGKRQIVGLVFATLLRLIVWPMLALVVVGPIAASGFFAWIAISQGQPQRLASLLLGIALLWQFVSVNGLSIAAAIPSFDPASLVRFPLRFGRYFVLRSLLGLMTPSTIVGCLAVLAAAVGIGVANASLALPALVVMPVYALMNIYLTRMIGAWMERWLANRRFREIFSMLMALFAVSIQFINLRRGPMHAPGARSSWLMNILHSSGSYLYWLPSGFAAQAILLVKHPLAALAQFAGLLASTALFAAIFAVRLHKQFLGEHLSEGVSRRVRAPSSPRVNIPAPLSADRSASADMAAPAASGAIFPPIVAECLRKEWLILRGNGTQLIGLLTPLLFVVIFSMNHAFSAISTKYFLPSAIAYVLIAALSSLYNIFGADGRGVQLYLLAPVRMFDVVLAKNLMSLAIIVTQVGLAWIIICVLARVSIPVSTQVSTALWTVFVVAMNLALGTLRSIQAPRHFVPGQGRRLRTTPTNRTSSLLVLAVLFGSMLLQIPVTMASSYLKQPWLAAWVFGPLAVAAVCAYGLMLRSAERLILAHRDVFAEELCKA